MTETFETSFGAGCQNWKGTFAIVAFFLVLSVDSVTAETRPVADTARRDRTLASVANVDHLRFSGSVPF